MIGKIRQNIRDALCRVYHQASKFPLVLEPEDSKIVQGPLDVLPHWSSGPVKKINENENVDCQVDSQAGLHFGSFGLYCDEGYFPSFLPRWEELFGGHSV